MATTHYQVSLAHLESPLTDHVSEAAYRLWLSLIEFSLQPQFPEHGVFRYKWKVLEARLLLAAHNMQAPFPIDRARRRIQLFNELREWNLIERRRSDHAYFIRAALKARQFPQGDPLVEDLPRLEDNPAEGPATGGGQGQSRAS